MKRRTISHFFEQKNLIKRRRMALLDKHTSLSRRVEANSQYIDELGTELSKFIHYPKEIRANGTHSHI